MLGISKCSAALLATVLALGLAACGDDEDDGGTTGTGAGSTTEQVETTATETTPVETPTETAGTETGGEAEGGGATPPATSPEEQEGGAGDEIPASSQASITGSGGKLSPSTVRVPPFIAIRVELRSADGVQYELSGGGKTVQAGGEIETAGTTFDGLRPGERLVLSGPQGRVTVVANAEPGP
ncbi:MAG TPA: hypothetical protein VHF88_01250 [Thermoleophilaceae bacterium]|nr:hypothetical protein [Thermoleophilaceae bacterium]